MTDFPRLIEHAFPLKQASLDSVHEKNVRHGHISTLHIWPARRPLAACRAALIATLLPDPSADPKPEGMTEEQWQREVAKRRQELCEIIGGKVVKKIERKKMPNGQTVERIKEETEGGILHWGRETENVATLESLRSQIIKAYGGRAPKVLDPFAGGGAIPLEAMRLGCEATAVDINPVAWFIQKCTLEYPQRLAGKTQQLPDFILSNDDFMQDFFKKAKGYGTAEVKAAIKRLHDRLANKKTPRRAGKDEQVSFQFSDDGDLSITELQADLAWHVRAWGNWVFDQARRDLAQYYPTYADFEPLRKDQIAYEHQPTQLLPLKEDGTPDIDSLNADFTDDYLEVKANPRWLAKPTVAYLWARTIECKNCRAIIPLLKSRWLSKKSDKRVLLGVSSDPSVNRVLFTIETNVPSKGGNAAQRREHDKRIGAGTMSRSGAWCPCCKKPGQVIMTMEDIRVAGQNGLLGSVIVAVAVNGPNGKEFRLPSELEVSVTLEASKHVDPAMDRLPFGPISELTATKEALGFRAPLYGFDRWRKYFTDRQMLSLGGFVYWARATDEKLIQEGYPADWSEAIRSYLGCIVSRTADYMTQMCVWEHGAEEIKHLFMRWALPMTWDFAEANPLAPVERFFLGGVNSAWRVLTNLNSSSWNGTIAPSVINRSAIQGVDGTYDIVFTDPPYYDAIPYSDLMDFFLVWLKRGVSDICAIHKSVFNRELSPKWNAESEDGELIDDSSRHKGDSTASKKTYEDGMFRAFQSSAKCLRDDGHMVVVFANKKPDAWETLAAAVIRAGFCVNGSWPIVTEMPGGLRNLGRASLASSVWLVCKKRPTSARPGWDNNVWSIRVLCG